LFSEPVWQMSLTPFDRISNFSNGIIFIGFNHHIQVKSIKNPRQYIHFDWIQKDVDAESQYNTIVKSFLVIFGYLFIFF